MFGWLAARSTPFCRYAPQTLLSRRTRRMTPQVLMRHLPGLGSVLYLHATSSSVVTDALAVGVLVAQRDFAPLLDTHWLVATSVVTDDGPREWCDFVDHYGRPRARLHLLPDTDYLAWDALMNSRGSLDAPPPAWPGGQLLRPDNASVVNFQLRELAGLMLLDRGTPAALSLLGDRVAAHIASAESAVLSK